MATKPKQISLRVSDTEFEQLTALLQAKSKLEGQSYTLPEFIKGILRKELQANAKIIDAAIAANRAWNSAFLRETSGTSGTVPSAEKKSPPQAR